ncbi:bifunctional protein farnesyltransferase/protein geranylgeranyltransferase NDAI_0C00210 [Naumovozyma dairenensis CBS 421]|uniref:Protein farnesyltransferase/geranylgeranyltransferase type-1 subunit alpha n=1 Tax=Naumovozyma dairenensis (strain ATCC 10597 / BCRC 20456 / CBS 421 / NBRC 0211 / NRRL Y-12639) TaxID=1071378 RepID=G0W7C1_NAUDC|nr:hypothetical protein NDAI_0C00210 [Naumovozyma dairenensis CBS 421]CCD23682.1 hypothetical protein NDAI_0C00210 [Naumovozyma dairenensis CBS 421]
MEFNIEDYKDVDRLPITTGLEDELCAIMYTDEYKEVMGIARSLFQSKEFSNRAKRLTSKVIQLAPAYYTIWNYRYEIIESEIKKMSEPDSTNFLNKELSWLDEITLNNPKNYQIWSYRQAIIKLHPNPDLKLEFPIISMMIDDDTKNYHVWSYRKWCILYFQDFSNELTFCDNFIQRDVYNNSAWTHRMFVWKNLNPSKVQIMDELNYLKEKIELVPQNISVWTYLRGLYENFLNDQYDQEIINFAETFINGLFDNTTTLPKIESTYALEFLADIYSRNPETLQNSITAYNALSIKYDPVRINFWNHKLKKLTPCA